MTVSADVGHCQRGACENAGFSHLGANDDPDAPLFGFPRERDRSHDTPHFRHPEIDDPAPGIIEAMELLRAQKAFIEDDPGPTPIADTGEARDIALLKRLLDGEERV